MKRGVRKCDDHVYLPVDPISARRHTPGCGLAFILPPRAPAWILLAVAAASAACDAEEAGPTWNGTVRDSAGVTLVVNPLDPQWTPEQAWRVEPDLLVAQDPARPETLFGYVADVAVDDEGRMYVLDAQAQAVRVLDRRGGYVRTLGGPGEGPGELSRFAFSVLAAPDTISVMDWGQSRITRFAPDGSLHDTEPMPGAGSARTWWQSSRGKLYFRSLARFTDDQGRWLGRDALLVHRGKETADTLLVFDYETSDLGARGAPNVPLVVHAPSWTVLDDERIAWISLDDPRLRIHTSDGRLERVVTAAAWTPRRPTREQVEAMTSALGDKLVMLGGSRESLDLMPVEAADPLPTLTSVRAGPDGTVWVQRMGAVEDVHPMALNSPDPPVAFGGPTWDVLDRDGRYLGSVDLPPAFRVVRITEDAIYGIQWDDFGVQRLVRLRLRRTTSGGGYSLSASDGSIRTTRRDPT